MNDWKTAVQKRNGSTLGALCEWGTDSDLKTPEAKRESLEHLLSIPIENALNQLPRKLGHELRGLSRRLAVTASALGTGINTFGDLLAYSHPPLAMLKFAKEFGKAAIGHGGTIWPRATCEVLYYASYAAALLRWNTRIGRLTKADLLEGFQKLASRPWLNTELRELFENARAHLLKNPMT